MKTLEEIIENNIALLEQYKEGLSEEAANELQISINVLTGTLNEYKNKKA